MRDSPDGIFGSWARWIRAPPDVHSCWDAVAAAVISDSDPSWGAAVPPDLHWKTPPFVFVADICLSRLLTRWNELDDETIQTFAMISTILKHIVYTTERT